MGNHDVPPGWYPDPAGSPRERWWDGGGWSGQLRETVPSGGGTAPLPPASETFVPPPASEAYTVPMAAGPAGMAMTGQPPAPLPAETRSSTWSRVLLSVLLAVVIAGGGIGLGIWFSERGSEDSGTLADGSQAPPDESTSDDQATEDGAAGDAEGSVSDQGTQAIEDPSSAAEQSADAAPSEVEQPAPVEPAPAPASPAPSGQELLQVNFDGACDVWLTRDELTTQQVRPWQFPGECPSAPVSLDGVRERWIVVVASLNGNDFRFEEALSRAAQSGLPGQVLWSSHYPSLNPDLWVVYDGPFPDRGSAAGAAEWRGGSSYPRVLSDDSGDRYCLDHADNCAGERRN